MQFYTKIGLTAIVITIIILIVLWYRGHFQSSELNTSSSRSSRSSRSSSRDTMYRLGTALQSVGNVIPDAGNKRILTMDTNSGDIVPVSASDLNSAISNLNRNDTTMYNGFPGQIYDAAQTAENGATRRFHEFLDFTPDSDTSLQEFNGQALTEWPAATELDGRGNPTKAPKPITAKEMYNTMLTWISDNTLSDLEDTANRRWVYSNLARLREPYKVEMRGSHQGVNDAAGGQHHLYGSSDSERVAYTRDNTEEQHAKFALVP
jgi:hypothetical protein